VLPTLYVVSTPIGNLEDITLRALRILKEVNLIAAEDTRRTAGLLHRYDIRTPSTSFHDHNEREKTPVLLDRLALGENVALVSDSGTPSVSDPGCRLVKAALDAGYRVQSIPGPSAVLSALVSSGFPADAFTFLGFPPRKRAARREWAARLAREPHTVVFFEAPHRLRATLQDLESLLAERPICLAKELTKIHEKLVVRPITELLRELDPLKGEYVVVVPPAGKPKDIRQAPSDQTLTDFIGQITERGPLSKRAGITLAARHFDVPSRTVYAALERTKKTQNRAKT